MIKPKKEIIVINDQEIPWENSSIDDFPIIDVKHFKIVELIIDLETLIGWKNIMMILASVADFRLLLAFRSTCKVFQHIANIEIARRMVMDPLNHKWTSNLDKWYVAERCAGYEVEFKMRKGDNEINYYNDVTKFACNKFEEPSGFKNFKCRTCTIDMNNKIADDDNIHILHHEKIYKARAEKEAKEKAEKMKNLRKAEQLRAKGVQGLIGVGFRGTAFKTKNASDL